MLLINKPTGWKVLFTDGQGPYGSHILTTRAGLSLSFETSLYGRPSTNVDLFDPNTSNSKEI